MTENEAIKELKEDCNELGKAIPCDTGWGVAINVAYSIAIKALEEIQQYRAIGTVEDIQLIFQLCKDLQVMCEKYHEIGTVEDIQQKLAELERWHATEVNPKIKNVFANTSTQICHNCDHKDEYIEELEAEIEELQALKEKAEPRKPIDISRVRDNDGYIGLIGKCPCCDDIVEEDTLYCDCGQKLDWSEEE